MRDPGLNCFARGRGDLKLDGPLRLPLQHDCPRCDLIAVTDVAHLQSDQIAASQLAVNSEVEQGELADAILGLKTDTECPDVFDLERCLLPDDLAFVPRLAMDGRDVGFHDGLPSS